jgi:hypothetical protein
MSSRLIAILAFASMMFAKLASATMASAAVPGNGPPSAGCGLPCEAEVAFSFSVPDRGGLGLLEGLPFDVSFYVKNVSPNTISGIVTVSFNDVPAQRPGTSGRRYTAIGRGYREEQSRWRYDR